MFHAESVFGSINPSCNFPSQPKPCAACQKMIERVATVYCKTCFSVSYCSESCLNAHEETHQKRCRWEQRRITRHFAILEHNSKLAVNKRCLPNESNDNLILNARLKQIILDIKINYPDGDLIILHGDAHRSSEAFSQEFQQRLALLPPDRQEERRKLLYQAQSDFDLVSLANDLHLPGPIYDTVWNAVKHTVELCASLPQSMLFVQRMSAAGKKIFEWLPLLDASHDKYLISGFIFKGGSKIVLEAALNKLWASLPPQLRQARKVTWERLKPHYEVLIDTYMCIVTKGEWEVTAPDPEPTAPMPSCPACMNEREKVKKVCGGCFTASYCCVATQKQDWSQHKVFCQAVKPREAKFFRQLELLTSIGEKNFQREIRISLLGSRKKYPDADLMIQKRYGFKLDEAISREFEMRLAKLPSALAAERRRLAVCMQEEFDHFSLLMRSQAFKKDLDPQMAQLAERLGSSEGLLKLQACHPIDRDLIQMFILNQANQEELVSHLKFHWATLKPEEAVAREAKWQAFAPHFPDLFDAFYNCSDMHKAF